MDFMVDFGIDIDIYIYFVLPEHTKRVGHIILINKKLVMVFSKEVSILLPYVRVCWGYD